MAIVEAPSGPINMTTASYGQLLNKEAALTVSRGNFAQQHVQVPHRSTKFLLSRQLQVNAGVSEETTPARVIATCSIWNAVSFSKLCNAAVSGCPLDSQYRYRYRI